MTNIAKHSKATSAYLIVSSKGKNVIIDIQDNGIGFNPKRVYSPNNYGLLRIKENTHLLGGDLNIISKKGKGTTLKAILPIKELKFRY